MVNLPNQTNIQYPFYPRSIWAKIAFNCYIISCYTGWAWRNEEKLSWSIKRSESTKSQNKQFINFIAKTIFFASSTSKSRDFIFYLSLHFFSSQISHRQIDRVTMKRIDKRNRTLFIPEGFFFSLYFTLKSFFHGLVILLKTFIP